MPGERNDVCQEAQVHADRPDSVEHEIARGLVAQSEQAAAHAYRPFIAWGGRPVEIDAPGAWAVVDVAAGGVAQRDHLAGTDRAGVCLVGPAELPVAGTGAVDPSEVDAEPARLVPEDSVVSLVVQEVRL